MATPENAKGSRGGVRWGQAVRRRAIENGRYVAYALARARTRTAVGFDDPFDASYDVGRHARTHGGATPVAHHGLPEAPR